MVSLDLPSMRRPETCRRRGRYTARAGRTLRLVAAFALLLLCRFTTRCDGFVVSRDLQRQATAGSSPEPETVPKEPEAPPPPQEEAAAPRNLYDVLGATGKETKAELKELYVKLAKENHPDSAREPSRDFSEIASAWRILSDPKQRKRYDRSLQAEQFSQDVVKFASSFSQQAAPAAAKALEQVAFPLLRRTTATTLASIQAAARDLQQQQQQQQKLTSTSSNETAATTKASKQSSADLSQTFQRAMAAAKRASEYMDGMERLEKADVLSQQVEREQEVYAKILEQLEQLEQRRIHLVLHTATSGLTSVDALAVLQEFNKTVTDEVSLWGRTWGKHTCLEEITNLQEREQAFVEQQQVEKRAQEEYQRRFQQRFEAKTAMVKAKRRELKLIQELQKCQEEVAERKQQLTAAAYTLQQAEFQSKRSASELDRQSEYLERQSEKVRIALLEKERQVRTRYVLDHNKAPQPQAESDDPLEEINTLRGQIRDLASKSNQLQSNMATMLSRIERLRSQAANDS